MNGMFKTKLTILHVLNGCLEKKCNSKTLQIKFKKNMTHLKLKCVLIFKLNIWIFIALLLLPIQINFWIFSYLTLCKRKLFFEHYNYGRNDTLPVHGETKVVIASLILTHCTCATITLGSVRLFALNPFPQSRNAPVWWFCGFTIDFFLRFCLRSKNFERHLRCVDVFTRQCLTTEQRVAFYKLYRVPTLDMQELCTENGPYREGDCPPPSIMRRTTNNWQREILWYSKEKWPLIF